MSSNKPVYRIIQKVQKAGGVVQKTGGPHVPSCEHEYFPCTAGQINPYPFQDPHALSPLSVTKLIYYVTQIKNSARLTKFVSLCSPLYGPPIYFPL